MVCIYNSIYIYISCGGRRLKKESKSRRRNCLLLFFIILKVVFSFMDIVFLGLDPTERAQTNRLLVKDEFIYNSLYCLYRQPLFLSQASNLDIKQFSWWRIVSGSVTDNSNTKILEKRVFRMSIVMPGKYIVCVCIYILINLMSISHFVSH